MGLKTRMLISTEQYFQDKLQKEYPVICNHLLTSVVPILEYSKPFYSIIGSSVYLKYLSYYFLVTACHVVENETKIMIPGIRTLEYLEGNFVKMNNKNGKDAYDIFVLKLDDIQRTKLSHFNPTILTNSLDRIYPDAHYSFLGYPISKTKKFRYSIDKFENYCYVSYGLDESKYLSLGYNSNINIVSIFEKEKALKSNLEHTVLPDLFGMSGGGIWKIMRNSEMFSRISPIFSGIIIEHKEMKYLIGVKKYYIWECVNSLIVK